MSKWAVGLALLVLAVASAVRAQQPLSAWVELIDGGAAEARAIVVEGSCPEIIVDGHAQSMQVRVRPDPAFPQTVCVMRLPHGAVSASIGGEALHIPRARIDRIVVLGDTGCRVKGLELQACNDPRAWPFAMVAQRAAAEKPDLVIHVGDYYYRETACPGFYNGCVNSPHGDLWPSWASDFFDPAQPLLQAAPWVFVRGNHESCARGWKGWFRMLDAGPSAETCPPESRPFAVPIGGVTLHVLDSADAVDRFAPSEAVALVARQLASIPGHHAENAWIVTHRPIWGEAPVANLGPFGLLDVALNATEQAAVKGTDLSSINMIVSGHIHHFASFDFGPDRPAQLIVGTGGDAGEAGDRHAPQSDVVEIDGMKAKSLSFQRFGYFLLERKGVGWAGVFKDLGGKALARCRLIGRALTCGAARS